MNLIRCIAGLLLATSAATGCVHRIDLEISAVELVTNLPVGLADLNGHKDARFVDLETATAGFVQVQFRTKADLKGSAVTHHYTIAALRPCGPDGVNGSHYNQPSRIFPENDGGYAAFFPARLDMFVRHDPDGGMRSGWPDATLVTGVCFYVSSLDMTNSGMRSHEIKLDRMAELLKR